jgi:CubicO group peptidase (beta-lactamase class C family)
MRKHLLVLFFFIQINASFSQTALNSKSAEIFCDTLIDRGIKESLVPGFAVSLIYKDSLILSKGWGVSSVRNKTLVRADSTLFELGSVGKVFTAIAALQQVQQGKLDLHRDVNEYLRAFKIKNPYSTPVTLFHLLTHTAGFDERYFGYIALTNEDVKPLEQHLKERMPELFIEPGKQINYSNYGYALAGYLVELASGESFADYVSNHILIPLNMANTTYFLPDAKNKQIPYAEGYRIGDAFEEIISRPRHTLPSGSIISTAKDMTSLLYELMHPSGKLLSADMHHLLISRQFTNHPLLMGYSLGLEEQLNNGIRGFGKGGNVPGFLAAVYLQPEKQLAVFVVTNTQADNFMERFSTSFFTTFFPDTTRHSKQVYSKVDVKLYEGVYRDTRYNHHTVEDLFALYQGKFNLYESGDSALTCYHNDDWHIYQPVNDSVFYNTDNSDERIIFSIDKRGRVKGFSRNIKLGMLYLPVTLEKVPWYDDPVMINEYYVIVPATIFTFVLILLFRIWVFIKRKRSKLYFSGRMLSPGATVVMASVMILFMFHFIAGVMFAAKNVNSSAISANSFVVSLPDHFRKVQYVTYLFPLFVVAVMWYTVQEWRRQTLPLHIKIYYTILTICTIIHFLFLWRWHFIGLNY